MPGNPAPDWYPDPENPAVVRWWDGVRWSGETRPATAGGGPGQPPGSPGTGSHAGAASGNHAGAASGNHAGAASGNHAGPEPFSGIGTPAAPVTGPARPPGPGFPAESAGGAGLQASWRGPALESWAAVYRSAEPAGGRDTFAARRWVLGGVAAVVVAGVAAWFLAGALAGRGGPAAPSPAFRGGLVTDRAAGIAFVIPGAGWAKVARPGDGFTAMYRRPAPGARPGAARQSAVAASAPLPAAIGYRGVTDLRADGVRAAAAVARRYFPGYHGSLHVDVRPAGGPAYVVRFRIPGGGTGQAAAVVIVGRGQGQRPGVLFVAVPDTMNQQLVDQITATAHRAP